MRAPFKTVVVRNNRSRTLATARSMRSRISHVIVTVEFVMRILPLERQTWVVRRPAGHLEIERSCSVHRHLSEHGAPLLALQDQHRLLDAVGAGEDFVVLFLRELPG